MSRLTNQLLINQATNSDIHLLCQIEQRCFTTDHLSAARFRALLNKPSAFILVARYNEELIASSVTLFRKNSSIARLYSLAVHPDFQRRGIAETLQQSIEQAAKKRRCMEIRLEVREDNHPAIKMYLKNGYTIFSRYEQFYEDGADAIRMVKMLFP